MPSAYDHNDFVPPRDAGSVRAFGLALLVHMLLMAALTWGVNWKRSDQTVSFEAELWSSVPQEAAPKPVETPTQPSSSTPDVGIAPEQEKKQEADEEAKKGKEQKTREDKRKADEEAKKGKEQKTREAKRKAADEAKKEQKDLAKRKAADEAKKVEAKKQEAADEAKKLAEAKKQEAADEAKKVEAEKVEAKKQKDADEAEKVEAKKQKDADEAEKVEAKKQKDADEAKQKLAKAAADKQRQENIRRIAGLAGATGVADAKGAAQNASGPSASYAGKVRAKVKPNIVFTEDIAGNPTAEVEVRTALDGRIISQRLIKPSGNKAWDEAVIKAIIRTETMPRDVDGRVPSPMILEFRPRD